MHFNKTKCSGNTYLNERDSLYDSEISIVGSISSSDHQLFVIMNVKL
jgi:hypothetical protein